MGWIGDTSNGRVCWFVTVVPSELILLTTFTGFLPLLVTLILYGIILYHALQKIVQLKKAAARHSGHQMGTLRLFVGGRSARNLAVASTDDEQQRGCCGCSKKRFLNCCRRYIKICLNVNKIKYVHKKVFAFSQKKRSRTRMWSLKN